MDDVVPVAPDAVVPVVTNPPDPLADSSGSAPGGCPASC
jgi:malate/lactate dehydrogenase